MPSKYVIREFTEESIYHVFNRGVEKRKIFNDDQDYNTFLYYLFIYSSPLRDVLDKYPNLPIRLQARNLNKEVEILSYCLMPNHFHFMILQHTKNGISKLLKQITNAHAQFFNKKYKRVGGLMQGRFKAVRILKNEHLIHVSRYIHLNPLSADLTKDLTSYKWSSYNEFITNTKGLCKKDLILSNFSSKQEYKKFIQDQADYQKKLNEIKHFIID